MAAALIALPAHAAHPDPWRLYIDADFTHTPTVGRSIERGVRAALDHHGMAGRISVLVQDHRGNSRRSVDAIRTAASDPMAIAVIGGMHSPPYLSYNADINVLGIPVLLPWSSSAAITRSSPAPRNWMFRVSVDDRVALPFLAMQAQADGCRAVARVVADTPWGTGVAVGVGKALSRIGLEDAGLWRLSFGAGTAAAAGIAQQVAGADCILLAAGPHTSGALLGQLALLPRPPRVISHWELFGYADRHDRLRVPLARIDLRVIGTCASRRVQSEGTVDAALARRAAALAGLDPVGALDAPYGFFHAFDAVSLLLAALDEARRDPRFEQTPQARRAAIRQALYALPRPVDGLVKTYDRPFSPFSPANPDGHEAIGPEDLCMTRFDAMGRLRPSPRSARAAPPDHGSRE